MSLALLLALEYSGKPEDKVPVLTDRGRGQNQSVNKQETYLKMIGCLKKV